MNRFQLKIAMIALALAIAVSSARAQTGGAANYFYDANGRLTAVLSPTGEAAIYSYDPAGNFTSITRRDANTISIIAFTPGSGAIGNEVTIYGTGFVATPASNTVKFNGVTATVTSATKTVLKANVPTGATTGLINITNANGAINSSGAFFVVAATIEFSNRIQFGADTLFTFAKTSGFAPLTNVGLLSFDGVSGQRVSFFFDGIIPFGVAYSLSPCAQVSVIAPSGSIVTTIPIQTYTQYTNIFGYRDPLTLAETGTYTMLIDPADALGTFLVTDPYGFAATARVHDMPADITGAIAASGLPTPVSFTTPGQNAVLTFSGLNGQRICLRGSQEVSTLIGTDVKLYAPGAYPSGTPIASNVLTSTFFVDTTTLTTNGTYTILLDPALNKTRTALLNLYDVPPDVSGTLTIGAQPVTINIPSVGQAALLTFTVTSTQLMTVHINGNFVGGNNATMVSLLRSDNTVVTSTTSASIAFDLAQQTLTAGTYRVKIDPQGTNAGNVSVNLTSP
jgi:YD repeat-containing protein